MINFDTAGLQRYLAEDPDGPVVMLNLLRSEPNGGAEKYLAYAQRFETEGINAKYGVEVLYAGQGATALVAEKGQEWDMVALVRYPVGGTSSTWSMTPSIKVSNTFALKRS